MHQQDPSDSEFNLAEIDRVWLSHELHDGLLQWIVGAKMQTESLLAKSKDGKAPTTDQLQYLLTLLSRAALEGRRLLAGLRPPELDEADWHVATKHWVNIAAVGSSSEVSLNLHGSTRHISDLLQRCAYRIVQESVGNALRHAKASKIEVRAELDGDALLLTIVDDGKGFDPASVGSDRYGLKGICERASLLDGSAIIDSNPGIGTRIEVRLPCPPESLSN